MNKPGQFGLCALFVAYYIQYAVSQGIDTCPADSIWGPDLTEMRTEKDTGFDETEQRAFLVFDREAGCYGKIKEFLIDHSDRCHDVLFQVYRPQSPGSVNYTLIGQYYLNYTNGNDTCSQSWAGAANSSFLVPREFQLPVQPDDVIGWIDVNFLPDEGIGGIGPINTKERLFKFEEGNSGSNQFDVIHTLEESDACYDIGESCPWDTSFGKVRVFGRAYSLNAVYAPGDPPLLDNLPADAQVAEHLPPGSFIYKVIANNKRNWNDVIPVELTYTILTVTRDMNQTDVTSEGLFFLNKTTGVVTALKELDHETIAEYYPDASRQATFSLTIRVQQQDTGPYSDSTLRVYVIDVNEPHDINNLPMTVTLDSRTPPSSDNVYDVNHEELPDLSFSDQSFDNETYWPTKFYTMINADPALDIFTIVYNSGMVKLDISDTNLRRWQGTNSTQLYITCSDGYYTTTPKILTVVISNLWQPPYLINLPNVVSVPENTITLPNIYQVTSWADLREGSKQYNIRAVYPPEENPPDGTSPFEIDSSGIVSINQASFDYRRVQKYEVEIAVTDSLFTDPSQVKAENLTVEITLVNKSPFWIDIDYFGIVKELSYPGKIVDGISLLSDDLDIPFGDWIEYVISGDGAHVFYANNKTHRVHVAELYELTCKADYERFNLTIAVLDSTGASVSTDLTIEMSDINNNAPEFNSPYYQGTVNELWLGGTSVPGISITITDCDSNNYIYGEYGVVDVVVVEEDAREYFEVGFDIHTTATRTLKLKQPISFTDYQNITFTLLVSDRGDPRLNATATVVIDVIDENNNPPEFEQEFYDLEERHDAPVGHLVETLETIDPDSEINSNVTYFLLLPDQHFTVEGSIGEVKNHRELDAYRKYILYAYARDYGDPELYSDPSIVRIDTYPAKKHLVDIHMQLPLDEFKHITDEFLFKLNRQLAPWVAKEEITLLNRDKSVLAIYALTEAPPPYPASLEHEKYFVHVDDLLDVLSKNIQGEPKEWLRSAEFSEYQIFKVVPTYPYWFVDTVPGIITLTLLCLLLLALLLLISYLLYFRKSAICFRKKIAPVKPKTAPPRYETPLFDVRYANYNHARRLKKQHEGDPFVTSASGQSVHKMGMDEYDDRHISLPGSPVPESNI